MDRIRHPQRLEDLRREPDRVEISFVGLFEGWPDDLERLHASLSAHLGGRTWELVVVDNPVDDEASARIASLERTIHLPLRDRVGYAAGRNLGLRRSTGEFVVVVDTSVALQGDVVEPLRQRFADRSVGVVGRWGVVTSDGFSFEESEGPDVHGVEGYFMAMRRADLDRTGIFDPKFRFYRNADIDLSFQIRDAGLRAVVDPALPVVRYAHRLWESTPADERDELSRRNFFRFRDHWGGRGDLFRRPRG